MELIVTHLASDFDSFAGMVAAKKIFPNAEIILPSSINQNVREFITLHKDSLPQFKEISEIDLNKVKMIIIIDTKIANRLGPVKKIISDDRIEKITIDHHQKSKEDIKDTKDYFKNVGSTTTIIVQEIIKRNIAISQFEATLFALGIYEDTGNFTYPNVSFEDLDVVSFLLKNGANLYVISKFLNLALTQDQHNLLEKLILNSKEININEKKVLISFAESENYIEGLSVLTRKLALIEDRDIVFCWVKMKDKIYLVGRSDDISVNVSKILAPLGGGGHKLASSAVIKDKTISEVEKILIESLEKNIKKPILAKDIMTYPVKVIDEDSSIMKANELLKKYGHSGIPIVNSRGILTGILTRKDVDKAIRHGLSHAPVKGFKSGELITAGPNSTIDEIQRLMIENSVGRIPIVLKNKILGIITRKDLLRALNYYDFKPKQYLGEFDSNHTGPNGLKLLNADYNEIDIIERIKKLFPDEVLKILNIISNQAKEMRYKVYLVGGMVRDILLNKSNLDIDIVVEGDGVNFASMLAPKLNAKIWTHRKFKTSVIVLPSEKHIDVATARVESYDRPAALPNVEEGSIRQDLYRRDFTINSMAISLNKENFGELIDYFGGIRDLKQKKIRVMHKLSFIEDPTRIFRAVRFEQRFGFKIDKQTESLIEHAIKNDIITKLTGVRIRDELISIVEEENPWRPLKRLSQYNALKKIKIDIDIDKKFQNMLRRVINNYNDVKIYYGKELRKYRLIFSLLLSNLSREEIILWCSEMKVKKRDTEIILSCVFNKDKTLEKLSNKKLSNSELYEILAPLPPELLVILVSYSKKIKNNVLRFIKDLKDIKLSIDGNDLLGIGFKPSGEIGEALKKLLLLKLDNKLSNKQEEIEYAKKILSDFRR